MTDYSKTKIYKIESHLGDKIYIGSTSKEYLSQRFQLHKSGYKQWKKGQVNKTSSFVMFDEYGPENCQIVLIELYPCNCKDERNARESHYIRTLDCVNKVIPDRTYKQRCVDKKEIITKRQKEYYEGNKDKMKEYYKENREKILERKKQLYYQNKDKKINKEDD